MTRLPDDRLAKHAGDVADAIAQQGPETWWPMRPAWELQAMIAELQAAREIIAAFSRLSGRFIAYDAPNRADDPERYECLLCGAVASGDWSMQHNDDCPLVRARQLKAGTA